MPSTEPGLIENVKSVGDAMTSLQIIVNGPVLAELWQAPACYEVAHARKSLYLLC